MKHQHVWIFIWHIYIYRCTYSHENHPFFHIDHGITLKKHLVRKNQAGSSWCSCARKTLQSFWRFGFTQVSQEHSASVKGLSIIQWVMYLYIYIKRNICICIYLEPFDDTCFDWSLGLVLGGWPSKVEVIWVPGIYIYIYYIYIYTSCVKTNKKPCPLNQLIFWRP